MKGILAGIVSLILLGAAVAEAQSYETPPDIVRTKDGGMLRGSIIELSPGAFVLIALPSGEQRKIAMSEVSYAGPARDDPASPPAAAEPVPDLVGPVPASSGTARANREPARPLARERKPLITVHAPEARLRLRSDQDGLTFLVATAAAAGTGALAVGFERICTAPCDASMPAGSYRMALSPEGAAQRFVEAEEEVTVEGPSVLTGTYDSAAGTRTAGWLVLGIGSGVGAMITLGSVFTIDHDDLSCAEALEGPCDSGMDRVLALALVGAAVTVGSIVVGLILGTTRDEAHIRVEPAGG